MSEEKKQQNQSKRVDLDSGFKAPAPRRKKKTPETARQFTWEDVRKHKSKADCWVVIHGKVYDVSKYLLQHPGGSGLIDKHAGADCTDDFEGMFHSIKARDILLAYLIGDLQGAKFGVKAPTLLVPSRLASKQKPGGPYVFGGYGQLKPGLLARTPGLGTKGSAPRAPAPRKGPQLISVTLQSAKKISRDTALFVFALPKGKTDLRVPCGHHVYFFKKPTAKGERLKRPYTPIADANDKHGFLQFAIKHYKGEMTNHLFSLKAGDTLEISKPIGTFNMKGTLERADVVVLICAGTGVTAMISLLRHCNKIRRQSPLSLWSWQRAEQDFILKPLVESLVKPMNARCSFIDTLKAGKLTAKSLAALFKTDGLTLSKKSFVGICGTPGFNTAAENVLQELKYEGAKWTFA